MAERCERAVKAKPRCEALLPFSYNFPSFSYLFLYFSYLSQVTSAYVSLRQLTSAYVSLRQLTSAYVRSGPWGSFCLFLVLLRFEEALEVAKRGIPSFF